MAIESTETQIFKVNFKNQYRLTANLLALTGHKVLITESSIENVEVSLAP